MPRRRSVIRRRWSLRIRLTAAFASVMALVLAVIGGLVLLEFARDLDGRLDEDLAGRAAAVRELAIETPADDERLIDLAGEEYAQVYEAGPAPSASSRRATTLRLLTPAALERARRHETTLTLPGRPGHDDGTRVHALAVSGNRVFAVGEDRNAREASLNRLAALLGIGLPAALILASLAGYGVAGAALRPVERMRGRAAAIGSTDTGERLPEPHTGDELDRLARTLNELLDRLHDALERERRIVGDASHELRTPIAVLRTRLDVALRGDGDPEHLRAALEEARQDTVRLTRLADDLLVLARADTGQLPLRREPLDVQDLLEAAAARHPAEVAVEIQGGAVVLADADRVAQALDNLLVNAERYGRPPLVLVARPGPGETVELAVRDHGDGIPPDFLPRAFERFSQADPGHGGEGTGLGLAIVEAIARAHGGGVRAVARGADGGAEVAFTLPCA